MTIMVMPMAGKGIRTLGFSSVPKPLILINNHPMFYWATQNIVSSKKIFIVREDHISKYQIDKEIKKIFPESTVLVQIGDLDGQLMSTLIAEQHIDTEEDIVFVDCDMFSEFTFNDFLISSSDCSLLTFNSSLDKYSYVSKNNNIVDKIIEKKVISNDAVGGVFYWKSGKTFLKYAKQSIEKQIKINNEYYISSAYSEAISEGVSVSIIKSEKTYDLSIDSDIEDFEKYEALS